MTRPGAQAWIARYRKVPSLCDSGEHRWTLQDGGRIGVEPVNTDELRDAVFNRLVGGDKKFPWLFPTPQAAIEGLILALMNGGES